MPKKFKGENSKAAEARARKDAQRHEEAERKQKDLEDQYWKDDDKHVAKKQQRKVTAHYTTVKSLIVAALLIVAAP